MTTPPMTFDPPVGACPLCGSTRIAPYDRDFRGVTIARCGDCGVKFMNPQYTDAYLAAYYANYNSASPNPRKVGLREAKRESNFAFIERHVRPGRLLAIGVGSGDEVRTAQARGWTVEGYDVDPETTQRLAERLGITIYSGDLGAAGLQSGAYDCVYMDQVLEHPKNPGDYLRLARRVLQPTGVLYVGVPNIGSISAAWQTVVGKLGLKRRRGRHYDSWHHLFYYSPTTLSRLLQGTYGFTVIALEGDPFPAAGHLTRAASNFLQRRIPLLDSSFRLLARPAA